MVKLSVSAVAIALCFLLPIAIPRWQSFHDRSPGAYLFCLGVFIVAATILAVVLSPGLGKEFVYANF